MDRDKSARAPREKLAAVVIIIRIFETSIFIRIPEPNLTDVRSWKFERGRERDAGDAREPSAAAESDEESKSF